MASPQDYTSMPWTVRASVPSTSSSAGTPIEDSTAAQGSNDKALMQQLTESHAAQRDMERRIAVLHKDHSKRNGDLLRELDQARKREDTIRTVFEENYEKEQELARRMREVEEKEAVLRERERFLEERGKELEEKRAEVDRALIEQAKPYEGYSNYSGITSSLSCFSCEPSDELFKISPDHELPKWFGQLDVQLLRKHDYYKGWLDCMRVFDLREAALQGKVSFEEIKYIFDADDYRSARNAGHNVGLLFAWSALCKAHGVPHRDARLDDRQWLLEDLVPKTQVHDMYFWEAVEAGKTHVEGIFWKHKRTNTWGQDVKPDTAVDEEA